ncbi:arginine--tRNA ligase [Candidatus Nitrosotalea okcheonensis]|uniref:Arginine--tRNA ligase n=1 Tax=Candidatus Nitrosotalea okcheonensis TaxID=1903276 RepID=A0A2H1FE67_9ARCH|nr:arginine--tRNA ligase [Candidatus Nitrosotalea okcheonensis]SMH71053.1 Arginine--tRNA ligase [Candidatus Nitrosotalea okcheonensis]
MTLRLVYDEIRFGVKQACHKLGYPEIEFDVSEASRPEFGDVSCNVGFLLAKTLKKRPLDISQSLAEEYKKNLGEYVSEVSAHASGYLNFVANYSLLVPQVVHSSLQANYGSINLGKNSKMVIEHTSVNPNKALHVGHIRNIIIGDTVARILHKASYDVSVLNYVDDSGLQVADIIVGFKYGGYSDTPPDDQKFDHYCGDIVYVKTTERYETDKAFADLRSHVLQELEEETSDLAKFGDEITRRVLEEQLKTCWRLGATYDCLNFESQIVHSKLWQVAFEKMKSMGITELEQEGKNAGCWVIKAESEDDKVLVRSNGTATYVAKDIPYAAWKLGILADPFYYKHYAIQKTGRVLWQTTLDSKQATMHFTGDRAITVIDSRQSRLQNIITKIMSDFKSKPDSYIHLGYESVTLSPDTAKTLDLDTGGKSVQMSGRKGIYVSADYVLDILSGRTFDETKKRNSELDEMSLVKISEQVAIGALRYAMIKQDLDKIITFDLTESLSLEGDTGPYIQYAHARAMRILEKYGKSPNFGASLGDINTVYEKDLIKIIGKFDLHVEDAAKNLSPKIIAKYCYHLAVSFNTFYEHVKVLTADSEDVINARLCLVYSFKETLAKALQLLGIDAPERM